MRAPSSGHKFILLSPNLRLNVPVMSYTLTGLTTDLPFRGVLARRICAFLVDAFVIGAFSWAAAIGIFLIGVITLGFGFLMFHIIPLMPFVYYTLLLPQGGTLGQRLFGLSVREDSDLLRAPNYAEAFVWSLLLWVSFVLVFLPFLLALTNPRRRAGHDLLSGLVIIRIA
jgi:uncharacterized RDD family membrane protein YckC